MLTLAQENAAVALGTAAWQRGAARDPMLCRQFEAACPSEAGGLTIALLATCWLAGWDKSAFAANAHPVFEPGAEGMPQAVIPGAEREPVRQTLERKMEGGKRSEKPQREPGGLFGDASRQLDLF